ncbi:MAG: dihydrofolate reductase family protein [Roseibium sp.]|uniref:dihydrofolate reductase family protein n=1 Tax=Roseibium sp. TaxID=1936156 RepID=UPI0026224F4E|nr:dihydrofolate reductase family protein [Roseibium sp.]MCV0426964.1 dihydrofolate reductase family protein [Roseibium sp.]
MPTGHVMMAMTLDGFVARKDHTIDWLMKQETQGEDYGFEEFMSGIDVIVMGSGSFRTVLGFNEWAYNKPVIVLSRSLNDSDVPEHLKDKVKLSRLDPDTLMSELSRQGINRVYVDGAAVVQTFLRAGYIEDMKVTLIPILIGSGIRLFGDLDKDMDLRLDGVREFKSGLVDLRYRVI